MKFFPSLAFLALGLSAFLVSCSTAMKPDSISLSVADLKAAGSASETRVVMTVRYTSDSVNAVGFSGSTHKLYLNGSYVGRAASSTPIGLPPLSTATQDVILVIENVALVRQLAATQGQPVARYRLESILLSTTGEDEVRIKISSEGSIDLHGLQATGR